MIKSSISKTILISIASLMLTTGVVNADTKVKSRQTSGGQTMENTSYIKGKRQRTEMNNGQMVTVQQCDLQRNIQIMPQTRAYIIQPYDTTASTPTNSKTTSSQPAGSTKGGVVTSTVTTKDTGERKQMFGYTARHIITTIVMDSTPDACSPVKSKMELDGWYIDAAFALNCGSPNYSSYRPQGNGGGCRDRYETKQIGTAKRAYPVWEKTTMFDANGTASFSTLNEVIEFSQATLDPSLFDVPAGYREVQDFASAFSSAGNSSSDSESAVAASTKNNVTQPVTKSASSVAPKKAGVIRFGLAAIRSTTVGNGVSATELAAAVQVSLTASLKSGKLEVVPIEAQYDREVTAEARQKECDYLIYANVSHKKGGGGFGSAFSKGAAAIGYGAETQASTNNSSFSANIKAKDELTLDVRVETPGTPIPLVARQFKAKATSAGEDLITPVSQQAAQAIAELAAK